jgi:hypothetical protein
VFSTECQPNLLISYERAKSKDWKIRTIGSSGHEIMIDHPQELAEFLLEFQKECTR